MGKDTKEKPQQNYIAGGALQGSDLAEREEAIVADIELTSGFKAGRLISRSNWWSKDGPIGAFHYAGTFEGKPSILKVQGVKPTSSEAHHINHFRQNALAARSSVRPPHLYFHIPWDKTSRYEALILEALSGEPIVGVPTTDEQLTEFFQAYFEYRKILVQEPWISPEPETLHVAVPKRIHEWMRISSKTFPDHPLRKPSDAALIQQGVDILAKRLVGVTSEFQHGHFSHIDTYRVREDFVVLSNLYWSWRMPLYDAIFAYHWHRFSLPGVSKIDKAGIDEQQALWLSHISKIQKKLGYSEDTLKIVFLERALAGVALDGLSADKNAPMTPYILDSIREDISRLISELE